jgi:hypothetical protein
MGNNFSAQNTHFEKDLGLDFPDSEHFFGFENVVLPTPNKIIFFFFIHRKIIFAMPTQFCRLFITLFPFVFMF